MRPKLPIGGPSRPRPMSAFLAPAGRRTKLALAVALGVFAGVGLATFRHAEGLSYFSADPRACVNCHIMRPQYDGWQKASHHTAATCVDCHLPASFVPKYVAKARNGWHHSKGFTLQDFDEPISIKPPNAAILQANCVRCHAPLVEGLAPGPHGAREGLSCVHCHASVGHGQRAGVGGRLLQSEIERIEAAP